MNTLNYKEVIGLKDIGPYYWIGKCINGVEYFAGQTFTVRNKGLLKTIKIHPEYVVGSSNVRLSVFELNDEKKEWKSIHKEIDVYVDKKDEGKWVEFNLQDIPVSASKKYGFKLSCLNGAMIAISENPWNVSNPYSEGEEWVGSTQKPEGTFHKDFDLAFEAILE
jgi:hypothetical protein